MKKLIILAISVLLLCGCEKKKCIKAHEELADCVWYQYIQVSDTKIMIPHHYTCTKTICDEYEIVKD